MYFIHNKSSFIRCTLAQRRNKSICVLPLKSLRRFSVKLLFLCSKWHLMHFFFCLLYFSVFPVESDDHGMPEKSSWPPPVKKSEQMAWKEKKRRRSLHLLINGTSSSSSPLRPARRVSEVWDKVIFRWKDRPPPFPLLSLSLSPSPCLACARSTCSDHGAHTAAASPALRLVSECCAVAPSIHSPPRLLSLLLLPCIPSRLMNV